MPARGMVDSAVSCEKGWHHILINLQGIMCRGGSKIDAALVRPQLAIPLRI